MKQPTKQYQANKLQTIQNPLKSIRRHMVKTQLSKESNQLGTDPLKSVEKEKMLPQISRVRLAQQNWMLPPAQLLPH